MPEWLQGRDPRLGRQMTSTQRFVRVSGPASEKLEDDVPADAVHALQVRLKWHYQARHARWLRECNAELAAWPERNVPSAVVLDEVTQDGAE